MSILVKTVTIGTTVEIGDIAAIRVDAKSGTELVKLTIATRERIGFVSTGLIDPRFIGVGAQLAPAGNH